MKKIVIPKQEEIAEYYSDFKTEFNQESTSQLTIKGQYGSEYDMQTFTIDLTDNSLKQILRFLKPKLEKDIKEYWVND